MYVSVTYRIHGSKTIRMRFREFSSFFCLLFIVATIVVYTMERRVVYITMMYECTDMIQLHTTNKNVYRS